MYFLRCQVTEIAKKYIVVENQGRGYQLNFLNSNSLKQGSEYLFYIFEEFKLELKNHITYQLFAFLTKEEYELFKLLLTIKGIGTKTSQKILTNSWEQLYTLANSENRLTLAGFKGFNLQLADVFIDFFRDSKALQKLLFTNSQRIDKNDQHWNEEEIISSLAEIGYDLTEIKKTLNVLRAKKSEFQDFNSLISECLKTISQANLR